MKDPVHKEFVEKFRHGTCTEDDVKYLQDIQLTNDTVKRNIDKDTKEPVIIVRKNDLRCYINFQKSRDMARSTDQKLLICIAKDKCNDDVMNDRIRREVLLLPDGSITGYGSGLLPLVKGIPVMVKTNIGTEPGVCNGSMGTIVDIQLDRRERVDYE